MKQLLLLALFAFFFSPSLHSQSLFNSNNAVGISLNDFRSTKLDGLLPLESLYNPDDDFMCLSLLGDPATIVHTEVVGVGEEIIFNYHSGIKIGYGALSQPEYLIVSVEISNRGFLEFPDGNRLMIGSSLLQLVEGFEKIKSNSNSEDAISIRVDNMDITRIYIRYNNYIITAITIYF